jgi:AcrR family transcriptional regulator
MLAVVDEAIGREQQLLEQARELFSRVGYRETSLQEIADRLGITRPLFYYYFESKEALLWALIGHLGDDLLERARPIAASKADPDERLRDLVTSHVDTLLMNADAFRIYFAERHLVTGTRDRRLRRGEKAYLDLIAAVLAEGQRGGRFVAGDPQVLAHFATGLPNSLLGWYTPGGPTSAADIGALVADTIAKGLALR